MRSPVNWSDAVSELALKNAKSVFFAKHKENYWADFYKITYSELSYQAIIRMEKGGRLQDTRVHLHRKPEPFAQDVRMKDKLLKLTEVEQKIEDQREVDLHAYAHYLETKDSVSPIVFLVTPLLHYVLLDGGPALMAALKRSSSVRCALVWAKQL